MVEEACRCDDGFGVAHSHIYAWQSTEHPRGAERRDTGWITVWVNWKDAYRALGEETWMTIT